MPTLEKFKYYMDIIQCESEFIDSLIDILRTDILFEKLNCQSLALDLIGDLFRDTDDWIGYWAIELDFGKRYKDGCVTEEDGTIIPLRTVEDLYNFLVSSYKEGDIH
jgi:hypothetical protein